MSSADLAGFGWGPLQAQELAATDYKGARPARVLDLHRSVLHVAAPGYDARLPLPLKPDHGPVTVGDWVLIDESGQRIIHLFERCSVFRRRAPGTDRSEQLLAANVDTLFVVSSCNQDFNEARLERYLAVGRDAGAMCLIVLTKADVCENAGEYLRRASRLAPGLMVEAVNALDNSSLNSLDAWLGSGQTIALLGSSGVGKSTLTNSLLGAAHIETQAVRTDDDKGRHTTTARQMYRLPRGAWVIDTPGMRELQLVDVQSGLDDVFAEIAKYSKECRFGDCSHETEPGCAVLAAVESGSIDGDRIRRWRKLVREEEHNRESVAERRARDKSTGKFYKSVISENQRRKGRN